MNALAAYQYIARNGPTKIMDLARVAGLREVKGGDPLCSPYDGNELVQLAGQLDFLGAKQTNSVKDGAVFKIASDIQRGRVPRFTT